LITIDRSAGEDVVPELYKAAGGAGDVFL
jgi:hypothetical protein